LGKLDEGFEKNFKKVDEKVGGFKNALTFALPNETGL
jgi:hypothetical protein